MNEQSEYWNKRYQSEGTAKPIYDLWLDKYAAVLDVGLEMIRCTCMKGVTK
jgi:hypothetical protein